MVETLTKKYPNLFHNRTFFVEDGWYWLLDNLCGTIQNHINRNPSTSITITDIKEKFGTLRFYFNGGDDFIDGMVHMAEHMSESICESCGSTHDVLQVGSWIKSLCENCAQQRSEEYRQKYLEAKTESLPS